MKLNLNTHDVYALVKEFQQLIGSQVVNVYDINTKTICIKLRCKLNITDNLDDTIDVMKSDENDEIDEIEETQQTNTKKHILKYLIIESSTKFYLVDNFKAINDTPSSFSSKLRKHVNNRRIESFEQLNQDRVIDITFGTDDEEKGFYSFHLIGEFYASGNIILTDNKYKIMTLVHPFTYKDENDNVNGKVKVGEIYPVSLTTSKVELTLDTVKNFISNEIINVDKKLKLKQFFMKLPLITFSPNVLEHVILVCGLNPNIKVDSSFDIFSMLSDEKILNIILTINELFSLSSFNGYIVNNAFIPYLYKQHENEKHEIFPTFSQAVTTHFNKIDKFETKEIKLEKAKIEKQSKQDKMLLNIQNQISGLKDKSQKSYNMIENIEMYTTVLQDFMDFVVNNVGITCTEIDVNFENIKLIEYVKHDNKLKFLFNDIEYVWDTTKSAYTNINLTYASMKQINSKIQNAEKVLETTTSQVKKINKNASKENIEIQLKEKKDHWFEQFNWFITSDGLYFVSGKSADQNELLVKKYFTDNDLYFHSEVFGSGSGILKILEKVEKNEYADRYAKSIEECGNFLICHTKAWQTNVPDRSYWVFKDQVSKTPETGEYNVKGAFIIRGTKNYINNKKMELGFGVLFKCKDDDHLQTECNENIEYALPIVGTYQSMTKYKFKVKLTPGTQKVGKMMTEVMSNFYKIANPYELVGIKKINNDDRQRVLVTGIKFHV